MKARQILEESKVDSRFKQAGGAQGGGAAAGGSPANGAPAGIPTQKKHNRVIYKRKNTIIDDRNFID